MLFGACIEGVILRDKYVGFYVQFLGTESVFLSDFSFEIEITQDFTLPV